MGVAPPPCPSVLGSELFPCDPYLVLPPSLDRNSPTACHLPGAEEHAERTVVVVRMHPPSHPLLRGQVRPHCLLGMIFVHYYARYTDNQCWECHDPLCCVESGNRIQLISILFFVLFLMLCTYANKVQCCRARTRSHKASCTQVRCILFTIAPRDFIIIGPRAFKYVFRNAHV